MRRFALVFALAASSGSAVHAMRLQDPAAAPATAAHAAITPQPRADQWIVARQAECVRRAKETQKADVVFVGDSITQGWEEAGKDAWQQRFGALSTCNLGVSGDRTEHVLWRLQQAPINKLAPKVIVLLIGTNNLGHGTSNAAETLAGVQAVAELLAAQCPKATIHVIEIFPRGEAFNAMRGDICQINQALRAWVAAKKDPKLAIHAIGDAFLSPDGSISKELMPDSLHLSARAYQMWADAIVAILRR